MPLPVTFFNLPAGDNPASLLDVQFGALAGFTVIPCSAVGQNAIQLRPFLDAPVVNAYADLSPVFTFASTETCTGNVTLNVNGLGAFPAFKANGATLVVGGDIIAGGIYQAAYFSGLNNGAGGFVVNVGGGGGGGGVTPGGPDVANVIMTTFTASGVFTPGPNLIIAIVEGMGAGGGGGAAAAPGSSAVGGGGGGSGGWFRAMLTPAQIGPSQAVSIGIGGTSEGPGTATTFGSLCSAGGGFGGGGNDDATVWGNGGAGGGASLASGIAGLAIAGCGGTWGQTFQAPTSSFIVFSGAGGHIMGGGAVPSQVNSLGVNATPGGSAAPNSGAGGSGAASANGGGTVTGGNGGNGWLQVTAYYSAP